MPLVRISMLAGKSADYRRRVGDAVHQGLVEAVRIPEQDRFQVISQHDADGLVVDRHYLGIERTDDCVVIQITLSAGRSLAIKQALFRRIADLLHERTGVRRQDVFINLVEVAAENWSFGNGEAQYAPTPPPPAEGAGS
jgi:4-oxalocrotonate tautomerase